MSDPGIHESLPDDLFRNRIAAALSQLDQPESDAEIAAALDAVDAEPISSSASRRIMEQVRHSLATASRDGVAPRLNRMPHPAGTHPIHGYGHSTSHNSQVAIVVACVLLLMILGGIFRQFVGIDRKLIAKPDRNATLSNQLIAITAPPDAQGAVVPIQRTKPGETLSTGPREKRRVTLPDGSVLSMNEKTTVTITGARRINLLAGEVFVEVVPVSMSRPVETPDANEQFVVETASRQITALGTKFVVKAEGQSTNVVVTQGKVQVSGVAQVIAAGQELIADLTESKSVELRPARRSAYVVEWVKDLMAAASSVIVPTSDHSGGTITVIDPQGQEMKLSLRKFHVDVHIEDGFARTTIDQTYFNHTWQQLEGTFRFPLPADASLSRLAMYVNGTLMEGGMVERDYGRNVFEQIRHTRRDPALLEWVDGSTFQMRVFPLEARQEKRILLSYTQRLPSDYGKSVYRFPAGHNLEGVREWSTHVRVKGGTGTKWDSPSHLLDGRNEGGDLIIDGREDFAAMDRDLVLELGDETPVASLKSDPAWSRFEQDGFQYVMVRLRPELKLNVTRQQRHWIFLIENSADRNLILAETQRQIAKVLLENSEHTDTFSIIRAGTQPDLFREKPVECSLDNVAAALDFLKQVAPIGALDLSQALQSVQQQANVNRESWIVHLGTGIPVLGERDQTTLIRQLPAKARYVGVGVGKRWSKSFMETAAKHSGGHVIQINPDEAVAWRAFDLLSTLNAPRLTEINIQASATQAAKPGAAEAPVDFLRLMNSVSHGQELTAVARLPVGQALPKSIVIAGNLNGEAWSQTVSIPESVSAGSVERPVASAGQSSAVLKSGHLPRTWARLEIDRLVALGSTENKAQIIELSKSMYVMSPFTSLLVLETEAMYEQFKVDRGRKDHWAMYGAPAQIPVVAEPAAAQLTILDAAKERLKQANARAQTAEKNYERSVAEKRPATDLKRLERLKLVEQGDVKLLESEIQRIERANAAAADPVRKAWESVILRRIGWQQAWGPLYAGLDEWRDYSNSGINSWGKLRYVEGLGTGVDDFGVLGEQMLFGLSIPSENRFKTSFGDDVALHGRFLYEPTVRYSPAEVWKALSDRRRKWAEVDLRRDGEETSGSVRLGSEAAQQMTRVYWPRAMRRQADWSAPDFELFSDLNGDVLTQGNGLDRSYVYNRSVRGLGPILSFSGAGGIEGGFGGGGFGGGRFGWATSSSMPLGWASPTLTWPETRLHRVDDLNRRIASMEIRVDSLRDSIDNLERLAEFDSDGDGIAEAHFGLIPAEGFHPLYRRGYQSMMVGGSDLMPWGTQQIYVSQHPLATLLQDLPSYAPGLQTWTADRLAIAEQASTKKPVHGTVDPEARRLIAKARSLGWESIRLVAVNQKPARQSRIVIADGAGRFKIDREISEGLKETVINDGTTLWHLYPEIGLGAKRSINRFHQSAIQSVIPWYVPTVDDLSLNADVTLAGERTVRIVAVKQDSPAPANRPKEQEVPAETESKPETVSQLAVELVFAGDGRLTELRLIDAGKNKLLAKQTIAADGTIRLLGADEKLLGEAQYERSGVEAPHLVPENRELVVLPLPYRSSDSVGIDVPMNLQSNTADFGKLSDDDALKLLATYFAEARQAELAQFIEQRFAARSDHRIGLAVLLASVYPQNPLVANATRQHPELPLARFLEQFAAWVAPSNVNGTMDVGENAAPFLKRLCGAYNVYCRWSTDRAATRERPAAENVQELDQALRYVIECRSVDLTLKLLATIQDGLKRLDQMNPTFARRLNAAATAIAADREIPAFARQARIEWLLVVGDADSEQAAEKLFRAHLVDAIDCGFVPELSNEVRAAFAKHFKTPDGQSCRPWVDLVREAAQRLSTMNRPMTLIAIARRCVALGETALATEISQMAIKDQALKPNQKLNLAMLEYAKEASDWNLAEACLKHALNDPVLQKQSSLWRDAARIAHQLQKFTEWIENLEKAYELEFAALPKTVNLEAFRQDYESLFGQLEQRTDQLVDANRVDKESFARIVQRAATRWREIDSDDTKACHRAARMLTKLGQATAAWNYWTTPLAGTPDLSTSWMDFANAMETEHRFVAADKAWTTAFVCEPTNPEILFHHAKFLHSTKQEVRAHALLTTIVTGQWQPRFEGTKTQAQSMLSGHAAPK